MVLIDYWCEGIESRYVLILVTRRSARNQKEALKGPRAFKESKRDHMIY